MCKFIMSSKCQGFIAHVVSEYVIQNKMSEDENINKLAL